MTNPALQLKNLQRERIRLPPPPDPSKPTLTLPSIRSPSQALIESSLCHTHTLMKSSSPHRACAAHALATIHNTSYCFLDVECLILRNTVPYRLVKRIPSLSPYPPSLSPLCPHLALPTHALIKSPHPMPPHMHSCQGGGEKKSQGEPHPPPTHPIFLLIVVKNGKSVWLKLNYRIMVMPVL